MALSTLMPLRGWTLLVGAFSVLLATGGFAAAADGIAPRVVLGSPEVGPPVTPFEFDGDVRDLPPAPAWRPGDPLRDIPMRTYPAPGAPATVGENGPDPLVELQRVDASASASARASAIDEFTIPTRNFQGLGFSGVNPPDTVGAVGADHFVQAVNTGGGANVRIWEKSQPSPTQLASFRLDNLGDGACASGFGDPIVLWDRDAERWLVSEFSSSGNYLCVYISQTADPVTGGWHNYGFQMPSFPDYPKYAAWATDANGGAGSYIVTANDGGPGAIALERGPMLAGQPSSFQRLTMPELQGFGIQGPAPADPDGPLGPPTGAPAIIMRHRDTEIHNGPFVNGDVLEMWLFDVDWQTPANTTLIQAESIVTSEFDSTVCGTGFVGCFAQPGSSTELMPIREVIMNRLQYYNHHDGLETLVGNYVVDVATNDQGGVRWFELRRSGGGPWTLHQEGTYSIDDDNRWMGSIAMDRSRNIALAYNVASSSTFPSLRYTGRLSGDPLGVMTAPESVIHAGTASNGSFRYGDYAAMSLDPTDDCTFWFTGMDNTSSGWRTQVASFAFRACGCLQQPLSPVIDAAADDEPNRVELFWDDSELETVVSYRVLRSRTTGGPYETIAVVPDSSPGLAAGAGYPFVDDEVDGGITYYYAVVADDGDACTSVPDNEVEVTPFGRCELAPLFDGAVGATSATSETCTVDLTWDPALAECGGPARYNVYRSLDPAFEPGPETLLVAGLDETAITDIGELADGQTYYYVVRALDLANGLEDANDVTVAVDSAGPNTGIDTALVEPFEIPSQFTADWEVGTGPGPHTCGAFALSGSDAQRPADGSDSYARALSDGCQELFPRTSTFMDSPPIDLQITGLQAVTLEFDLWYRPVNPEDATVEVWDGASWVVVWSDEDVEVNARLAIDVSPYAVGNPAFRVRFNYQNAYNSGWYSVDDVTLVTTVVNPCFTASAPSPTGDGGGASDPLRADRLDLAGSTLDVRWDAGCGAAAYNLLWGDLADVSGATPLGSVCSLGGGGAYTWSGAPAGNLWFLVVGEDGDGTESSWGEGTLGERNGLDASGECGTSVKNVAEVCQ